MDQLSAKADVVVACKQLDQIDNYTETVDDRAWSGMGLKEAKV